MTKLICANEPCEVCQYISVCDGDGRLKDNSLFDKWVSIQNKEEKKMKEERVCTQCGCIMEHDTEEECCGEIRRRNAKIDDAIQNKEEEEMEAQYLRWQQEMLEEEMKREVKEEEESDILDAMWLTVVNEDGFVNVITLRNVSSIFSSLYRVICSGSKERCLSIAITYLNREEK